MDSSCFTLMSRLMVFLFSLSTAGIGVLLANVLLEVSSLLVVAVSFYSCMAELFREIIGDAPGAAWQPVRQCHRQVSEIICDTITGFEVYGHSGLTVQVSGVGVGRNFPINPKRGTSPMVQRGDLVMLTRPERPTAKQRGWDLEVVCPSQS